MKRQWIAIGLAALGLVLFAFIMSAMAGAESAPVLQAQEQEPNDSFDDANPMAVPGSMAGSLANSNTAHPDIDTRDYFVFDTTAGQLYKANLSITPNPGNMQLRMTIYNGGRAFVDQSFSSATGVALQWSAGDASHYILVEALGVTTSTLLTANYQLDINPIAGTPTPTETPLPGLDPYEPNNHFTQTFDLPIAVSAIASQANFYPPGDVDWFSFYVKSGRHYQASTSNLIGVDTKVEVFDPAGTKITGDNDGGGGFASRAQWQASTTDWYHIKVTNLVSSGASDTYDITVAEVAAPPTATPTLVPDRPGQIDSCEDNSTLDQACTIASNYARVFNFVSPHSGPDNDHYRVWIKPGAVYNCRTSNLDPGVDPNMILYDQNRNAIGGNDDVAPGDLNSAFSFYATYSGWLYVLIGYGDRTPPEPANSNYTLNCTTSQPGVPTATSQPGGPAPTPRPPVATATLAPTAEPVPELTVRVLATPAPGPAVTPAPRFVPITMVAYYDVNGDWQLGAGEGIAGLSAHAYEATTNQLLAQGLTDDRGQIEFTVAAQGPVRVSIPFLGFSQLVAAHGGTIYVRVEPTLTLSGAS